MSDSSLFVSAPAGDAMIAGLVLTLVALAWVVVLVRVVGLRAWSKMTAYDFVITLASASLLASAASSTQWRGFLQSVVAIGVLMATQAALSWARRRHRWVRRALGNEPIVLMRDGRFDEAALARTRTAREDVIAKLRERGVRALAEVRWVVLETTGDISILSGGEVDPQLMDGVLGT